MVSKSVLLLTKALTNTAFRLTTDIHNKVREEMDSSAKSG